MPEPTNRNARVDDDDDLDDLDDVLDQFSAPAQQSSASPVAPSVSASTSTPRHAATTDTSEDDTTSELAREMESLFMGLMKEPRADSEEVDAIAERERFATAWEGMLVEGMHGMVDPRAPESSSSGQTEETFQSRIRSTASRLRESESGLRSSDPSTDSGDAFRSLFSQLEGLGLTDEDDPENGELQGMLEVMMGQLMSKEVLYEPLKELYEKFPDYLEKNKATISSENKERFEAQIVCIKRLLGEFEAPTYRDDDANERIVELMGELQAHGSPPEEIMGPLPPGFSMGSDGLPNFPEGCNLN